MSQAVSCPALLIAAPASGQGKTTLVAALARYHSRRGLKVRVFKTGPDFIDPMIHQVASGAPVHQLDLWMVGDAQCRRLLYQAACEADLILVEGVMGLFDSDPSSADLAIRFGLPVAVVIDASAMAQTFGAVARGLATYREDLPFAGVVANRIASDGHAAMLRDSLSPALPWLGGIFRSAAVELPERHLGLHQAMDIADLEQRLDAAADLLAEARLAQLPEAVQFNPPEALSPAPLLQGRRIAVARDKAFSFVYNANLDLLKTMGAELTFFSPLTDTGLPEVDAVYLPGGYPELYLDELADNLAMKASLRDHHWSGKPLVAECGGMLYLLESLAQRTGPARDMVGLVPGDARLGERLAGLGLQGAELPGGTLRGHTFHYAAFQREPPFSTSAVKHPSGAPGEGVYRDRGLLASFVHWYFPSNPGAAARLFLPQSAETVQ